ncbi:beta family protein [Neobacillus jeddahensis]|uniref:beta family protein n=1 Tax=Neobacillus jeddahensis TaxID=1461580 RepID=UPI00058B5262|nr:beta family protein [Neobacillus jeddahensis]
MFAENHYIPIVRWRRGEQKALEFLDSQLKSNMTPLIEIPPIPWDFENGIPKKTIDEHLSNIGAQVKVSWNYNGPVFIDAYQVCNEDDEIMSNGQHPLSFIINEMHAQNIVAIPVTGSNRGPNYQNAIKSIIQEYNNGYCLRLEEVDFDDIEQIVNSTKLFFNVKLENVDIILDYKYINPNHTSRMTRLVSGSISAIPELKKWRTLTFCATAFPENLGEIQTGTDGSIPRAEWIIYKKLLKSSLERYPSFGDYIISNPEYSEIDPRFMQMAASIRYTADDEFLIFRGYSIKSKKYNGWGQALDITKRIVSHQKYSGNQYSYGDEYIYNCSIGKESTGNPETWRRVGTNHHLTLAAKELSNLHVVSTVHLS